MALVPMKEILADARARHYGVPAFNVWDMGSIRTAVQVAEEEKAPLILAGAEFHMKYGGMPHFAALAIESAQLASVPIAVHLDHGRSFDLAMECIRLGFSSVMIDSSTRPWEENVAVTRQVVAAAHAVGVTVEAEIGHVGQANEELTDDMRTRLLTKPEDARRFAEETGVDALAIAVGNLHGLYKFPPRLEFDRLEAIAQVCPAYLVMHGGSGTPGLDRAVKLGCTKVNVGTDLQVAFCEAVQRTLNENPLESLHALAILNAANENMKTVMRNYIHLFDCNGKA